MHSIRSLILVSSAILGFAVLAPPAAAASFVPFTVTKTCPASLNPGGIPGVCLISVSSIAALGGAKIYYYGPLPSNSTYLSSRVVLVTIGGDTASGYCNVYRAAVPIEGICAFHDGSGALAGFEAVANVTVACPGGSAPPCLPAGTDAIWSWIGTEMHGP